MPSSACPARERLEAFAVGDLSGTLLDEIAEHVAGCPHCESTLEALDGVADALLSELTELSARSAGEAPPAPVGVVETLLARRTDSSLNLDPGRRLARHLSEGSCRLGRFELETELGTGSFGYVFRARDTELDRTVALKVQRAGRFASAEEVERFLREAKSAAQLTHPNIISIYDTEHTEDGVCYLVTEFVEGETLERRLESALPEPRRAAEWIADLAEALQYAHEHGIVHRDVKPSNVLLDAQDRPHIMDFGLAKRDAGETMTSDGRVMGTPAYMSPEQARGDSHGVDARSDIYSLGVMLYEMLSGERPFQGNRRMLLLQVLEDEPRALRKLNEQIPRDLETICLKAMAKSPGRRYQSAGELAEDLRRFLQGEPIRARPLGYFERLVRWCRRYPLAAGLLVAIPMGAVAGLLSLSILAQQLVEATALDSTRMEADMLERINNYYSEEVVGRLDWKRIRVTHEYRELPQSLPLPFTFMIDAGERITAGTTGMKVRIYSDHPWRKDGGPQDAFESRALAELQRQAALRSGRRSYYEFTENGGRPFLRYARGQIMQESCVKCHNGHKQSPRKNWNVGDLAGVLAITRPLDQDIERTRSGLRGSLVMMAAVAAMMTALSSLLLLAARRRSRTQV